jgi:hypothetical protein
MKKEAEQKKQQAERIDRRAVCITIKRKMKISREKKKKRKKHHLTIKKK